MIFNNYIFDENYLHSTYAFVCQLKKIVLLQTKILSSIIYPNVVPNLEDFVHIQNTNEDIFNETKKIFVSPLKVHTT